LIKELRLENFQCWKKQIFVFSPGLNVIIGKSGTGKSAAFLKAPKLLATNQPSGDEFISNWVKRGENMVVEALLEDNIAVFREKGKSTNLYGIGYEDGSQEDQEFTAFGKGKVPEEITKILRLDPINIQGQLDGPFMLNMSPGDVARELNRACKLEGIDRGISNSGKRVRGLEQKVKSISGQIDGLKDRVEELSWIEEVEPKIVKLEKKEEERRVLTIQHNNLKNIIVTLLKEQRNIDQCKVILKAKPKVTSLLNKQKEMDKLIRKATSLNGIIKTFKQAQDTIKEKEDLLKASPKLKKLITLNIEKERLEYEKERLDKAIRTTKAHKEMYQSKRKERDRLEKEFHETMPDICPLCGK